MIGEETADEGTALLSTAIGEIAEDLAGEAVVMICGDAAAWRERAGRLEAAGQDIAVLAKAMTILMQRSDAAE